MLHSIDDYRWKSRNIPLDDEVFLISKLLKHENDSVEVYVVGGAVRDFLYNEFHVGSRFKPKDIDLVTNLSEEEIIEKLQTPLARKIGIKVNEKESKDTFGVVFVSLSGDKNYEVAPFRKDIGGVDGRHPEKVERGTIIDDANRRDMTMNNLYYDIDKCMIYDFNPNGLGVQDIYYRRARMVGNPEERFNEDKLRILRFVRFYSRFNEGHIKNDVDYETEQAIRKFSDLLSFKGITHERIRLEFISGFQQSLNAINYLRNLLYFDFFKSIFPNMSVDYKAFSFLGGKNFEAVCACLLRHNLDVTQKLLDIKYSSDFSRHVGFLIDLMNIEESTVLSLIKRKNQKLFFTGKNKLKLSRDEIHHNQTVKDKLLTDGNDICEFISRSQRNSRQTIDRILHFCAYESPIISGEELISKGFSGKEIGAEQDRLILEHYKDSFQKFVEY